MLVVSDDPTRVADAGFTTVHPDQLAPTLADHRHPDLIWSPVIGESFDIHEVAAILNNLGYKGQLFGVGTLPFDGPTVRRDLQKLFPDLQIEILEGKPDGA